MSEQEVIITPGMRFMAQKLSQTSRNCFRIEPSTSPSGIQSGQITSVSLPESSTLDLHSVRCVFDATTTQITGAPGTANVCAKLPAAYGLVSRVEVFVNGIQLDGGCTEHNTVQYVKSILHDTPMTNISRDNVLKGAFMQSAYTDTDDKTLTLTAGDLSGFFVGSTRYVDVSLMGSIQIRITWADNSVLSFQGDTGANGQGELGDALSPQEEQKLTNFGVSNVKYTINNLAFYCDSLSFSPMYQDMLRTRIMEAPLPLNFKSYYTFTTQNSHPVAGGGTPGLSNNQQFSIASQSLDKIYTVMRNDNYSSGGKVPTALPTSAIESGVVPYHFTFQSYDDGTGAEGYSDGSARYQLQYNSVPYPDFQSSKVSLPFQFLLWSGSLEYTLWKLHHFSSIV